MAKATITELKSKQIIPKAEEVISDKGKQFYVKDTITTLYLITDTGIDILIGQDRDVLKQEIEQDKEHSLLDYRFFDDKGRWVYWAVKGVDKKIKPLTFPDIAKYHLTSAELYTKAVTYTHVLAHAVGLLKEKPTSLWDKLMKPTTIILAIVAIVFIMGLMLMALQG